MDASQLPFTHVAFADETNFNRGSFPGIALVSLTRQHLVDIRADISNILAACKVDEFKWEKLHSAKRRFAALQLIDYTIEKAAAGVLRVDVLTWDLLDGRHRVPKPDRIANLQRMYFHLFRNVLRFRWPDEALWHLFPDEMSAMGWSELQHYLEEHSTAVTVNGGQEPFSLTTMNLHREFHIQTITPCESDKEPLVQLADFFVGMGSYSRARFAKYDIWKAEQAGQPVAANHSLSHRDRERWQVIDHLYDACKAKKLGVSLSRQPGLRTRNPKLPINFWWYIPQHENDKAPSRP